MEKSILERFNNIINNKITIMRKILCILVAFDAHWESCSKAMATRSSMKIPLKDSLLLTTESPTYVNANNTTLKTDSIGYYHNKILDKISMSSDDSAVSVPSVAV